MLEEAVQVLQKYFGYPSFREGQAKIITSILERNDTFAIMPTGAGKSLCYQIPALLFPGTTLVVSPLISLMKDQVDALKDVGIAASFINSSLTQRELNLRLEEAQAGQYRILYVAPERLDSEDFLAMATQMTIGLVAIDEAHCVSQWGHDFRRSYRLIPKFIKRLPERPVMAAFTATATEEVKADIIKLLDLADPHIYVTGFDRPNLHFRVLRNQNKERFLLEYLAAHRGDSGIIYAATRKEVDKVYAKLQEKGFPVGKYHAGMTDKERELAQEAFVFDNVGLMVATNAFGMGIDKSNVRFVIHYNLPKNMESYYQEAGRAGRDGEPSECILLYSPQDIIIQKFLIEQSVYSPVRQKHEYQKLQIMADYAHTSQCLRKFILEYFGEEGVANRCRNCSNCLDASELVDMTVDAQKIISCIVRMEEQYGTTVIAEVLKGSRTKKVLQQRFDRLSTYGLMKQYTTAEIRDMINWLIAENYLQLTEGKYPVVKLRPKAYQVLKGKEQVYQRKIALPVKTENNEEIFDALRRLRKRIADREGVPPYIVFADSTLREMCRNIPGTMAELAQIKGVGETKLQKYGLEFLEVLKTYRAGDPGTSDPSLSWDIEEIEETEEPVKAKIPSHHQTWQRFSDGLSVEEIARERNLTEQTIQNHLLRCHQEGLAVDWERIIDPEVEILVLGKIAELATIKLKSLKEALPEEISYFDIQAVIARHQKQGS